MWEMRWGKLEDAGGKKESEGSLCLPRKGDRSNLRYIRWKSVEGGGGGGRSGGWDVKP